MAAKKEARKLKVYPAVLVPTPAQLAEARTRKQQAIAEDPHSPLARASETQIAQMVACEAPDEATRRQIREARWWTVFVAAGPDYPFELEVRIGMLPDGRFACTGLRINNGDHESEITTRTLYAIKLPDIVREAVRASHAEYSRFMLGYEIPEVAKRNLPRLRPGPPGYDDTFFREIADLYKESMREDPANPYRHFRAQWRGKPPSLSTARRWVQRARDKGFLGAAIPGKPGEIQKGSGAVSADTATTASGTYAPPTPADEPDETETSRDHS